MDPVPYSVELKHLRCSKRETLTFIKEQVPKGWIPELNSHYRQQQAKIWFRPFSKILQDILHCSLTYESYPLSLHRKRFQENHLGKTS